MVCQRASCSTVLFDLLKGTMFMMIVQSCVKLPEDNGRSKRQILNAIIFTLWLSDMAMENDPFIDDFPIEASIYKGFSMAMLNNQMVCR